MDTKKHKVEKDPEAVKSGQRLRAVILKYFDTQVKFAKLLGVSTSTLFSYITGNRRITNKMAMKMQEIAGINANYLLYGEEQMLIRDVIPERPYEIGYDGDLPREIIEGATNIFTNNIAESPINYIIPRIVLSAHGTRSIISVQGDVDIAKYAIAGVKSPVAIEVKDPTFCQKYALSEDCIFILNKNYYNGDVVLAEIGHRLYLSQFLDKKFYSILTDKKISVDDLPVSVIGAIYRKIESIIVKRNINDLDK